jgi:hypothetical protein
MNAVQSLVLRLRLWFAHAGAGTPVSALVGGAALFCWLWLIPYLETGLSSQRQEAEQMKQSLRNAAAAPPSVMQKSSAEIGAESFYKVLGGKSLLEQQIKVLFDLAKDAGLSLHQADYRPGFDKNGNFHTYQIQLPVTGSYSAVRQFCESTLLALPYASLDEMSFKREAVASGKLEAKLRFTLYLTDQAMPPADTPPVHKGVEA